MTKLTALTPDIAEVVTNLVTLSVMITVIVGTVIKMTKKESRPFVTVQQDVNKIVNEFLTKERMASRKKILERKFKAGDFDK